MHVKTKKDIETENYSLNDDLENLKIKYATLSKEKVILKSNCD